MLSDEDYKRLTGRTQSFQNGIWPLAIDAELKFEISKSVKHPDLGPAGIFTLKSTNQGTAVALVHNFDRALFAFETFQSRVYYWNPDHLYRAVKLTGEIHISKKDKTVSITFFSNDELVGVWKADTPDNLPDFNRIATFVWKKP